MTILENNKFNPESVMPICLPTSKMFEDTKKSATAVGMGMVRSQLTNRRCFTDGNGPEVLQQCA